MTVAELSKAGHDWIIIGELQIFTNPRRLRDADEFPTSVSTSKVVESDESLAFAMSRHFHSDHHINFPVFNTFTS